MDDHDAPKATRPQWNHTSKPRPPDASYVDISFLTGKLSYAIFEQSIDRKPSHAPSVINTSCETTCWNTISPNNTLWRIASIADHVGDLFVNNLSKSI
jgi:hypothetical protein